METFHATKDHVDKNPDDGKGAFETVTEWRDGAQAVTRARTFVIDTDEPTPLGGKDSAIDPMELLLGALGSCLTIGWVTQANLRGVEFRDFKIKVAAPFDLRGYLALDRDVRPGFLGLEYTVEVNSDAEPAVLDEIKAAAEATSPMFDNILNATSISGKVETAAGEKAA
jgi:uncharacterized OsmC-like protein